MFTKKMLLFLALIVPLASSSVTQTLSQVLDRFDVEGNSEIPLTKCSRGCTIYASISAANTAEDANHLLIYKKPISSQIEKYPIGELAKINEPTKLPFELKEPGDYVIVNTNVTKTGVPVVIYTVAIFQDDEMWSRVYEARLYNHTGIDAKNAPVILMSADPFTMQKIQVDGFVEIYASGHDALVTGTPNPCFPLYSGQDSQNLAPIPFPTPLMTISSKSLFKNITVSMGIDSNVILAAGQHSAILSPGYHGCGGTERYRYNETDQPIDYVITLKDISNMTSANFSLYSDIFTAHHAPVNVTSSSGEQLSFWGDVHNRFNQTTLQAKWMKVTSPPVYKDTSFAMRVSVKLNNPTTVAPPAETTTKAATTLVNTIQFFIIGLLHSFL